MQIFYAPDINGSSYVLDEKESRHSVRVLRMKKGEMVRLIDGRGNLYEGIIYEPDRKKCVINIERVIKNFEQRSYKLHVAISPLKNPERFEWFIEKSVELGVDEITPLICRNTEKPGIKSERIRSIIISAMKQSLKALDTKLNVPCSFNDFINRPHTGKLLIAHCNNKMERKGIAEIYNKGDKAVILIGPEGDFSNDEIEKAMSNNFTHIHLGPSRLRTETAGVAACHSIYLLNQ